MNDTRDMRRRAAALAGRLVAADERLMRIEDDVADLRARLEGRPGHHATAGASFEPTSVMHDWVLADEPGTDPATLTAYQHRVDDPALLAAREGDAFLRRYGLIGRAPQFAACADALRGREATLSAAADGAPDVSIIIPVHGQLGWTLNCLDALLAHESRASAEILVIDDASPNSTGEHLPALAAAMPVLRYERLERNLGFLRACNHAAAIGRGRLLVLLNNDTRVVAGWLDALVDSFALFPAAGLVGSKLLYPDGSLQEAGGIIWRDGSAWNYGRGDDPNRPHYSHARQVDYVSGASVAVPAALWQELGGFDARYSPAYGEDADLALRIRASGREIWLQPQSRVVHYEGKTSGTDLGQGVKAHQVANEKKLFLRWHRDLAAHRRNGEAPYLERERGVLRRALVIDATNPTPNQDAGSVTTTLTLHLFRSLGYKVHFVPQDNFLFERQHTEALLRTGIECVYAPYDTNFADYIARMGKLFDVVLVYRAGILDRVLGDLRRHAPQAALLFHAMDLHFLRMERAAALDGDAGQVSAAAAMRKRELRLIGEVDCTITHSTYEQQLLATLAPQAKVLVWPFMFEFHGTRVGFAPRRDFCFLGGYRHPPNVDAAMFLVRDVLPIIHRSLPDARIILAGANPGPEVQSLAGPLVEVTGMIDDLRDVFDRARVFACAIRVGAGTKGKISTAMAYGLPVVSTPCGAEGMDLIDGHDVLIGESAEAFAQACLRLHDDAVLWQRLSEAGQALVREKHSPAAGRRTLEQAIETALAHRLGIAPS